MRLAHVFPLSGTDAMRERLGRRESSSRGHFCEAPSRGQHGNARYTGSGLADAFFPRDKHHHITVTKGLNVVKDECIVLRASI